MYDPINYLTIVRPYIEVFTRQRKPENYIIILIRTKTEAYADCLSVK
jgi:hypothetical protein